MVIKTAGISEFSVAVEWAANEGWNPGLNDLECYHAADKKGFFLGIADSVPVASISAVQYNTSFGFIGFYIVKPEFRGMGFGKAIWDHGMNYLNNCCTVGLDGVPEQQENYAKSGFSLAWNNVRYVGTPERALSGKTDIKTMPPFVIRPMVPDNLMDVMKYDQSVFPAGRENFQKRWFSQVGGKGSVAIDANDRIRGIGFIRPCRLGYKIGPLTANDRESAYSLFYELLRLVPPDSQVAIDVPLPNKLAVGLAESAGMNPAFKTARMYNGPHPDISLDRIFGITSFEIG